MVLCKDFFQCLAHLCFTNNHGGEEERDLNQSQFAGCRHVLQEVHACHQMPGVGFPPPQTGGRARIVIFAQNSFPVCESHPSTEAPLNSTFIVL